MIQAVIVRKFTAMILNRNLKVVLNKWRFLTLRRGDPRLVSLFEDHKRSINLHYVRPIQEQRRRLSVVKKLVYQKNKDIASEQRQTLSNLRDASK